MAKVTMELRGFEALRKATQAAPNLMKDAATDLVEKSAQATAQRMRANAPVKTGLLRRSISSVARGLEGGVTIAPAAAYWRPVEYGSIKMPARPFVRSAAEVERPATDKRLEDIGQKLEQSWPKGAV
jgi:HK97 gp10 family phage protein